jgi:hypothetical protein
MRWAEDSLSGLLVTVGDRPYRSEHNKHKSCFWNNEIMSPHPRHELTTLRTSIATARTMHHYRFLSQATLMCRKASLTPVQTGFVQSHVREKLMIY